jgi:hypothetical protein
MKKNIITLVFLIGATTSVFAQSGAKWSASGNAANSGDFLGTTNNEALVLKANNTIGLKVKPNGELIFKSLDLNSNAPSGLVLTSGQGVISRLDFSSSTNQYLSSNGTWQNVPNAIWQTSGNNIFWNAGKVGIGTNNPFVQLDVIGDARISNNLYVGGGIVITDKVNATTEVKGWDIKVDNDLSVESVARLKGPTRIDQGFTFDGVNGMKFIPTTGTSPSFFKYGNSTINQTLSSCAANPQSWANHQFGGMMQIYDVDAAGTYIPGHGLLNFQTWAGGSSIDASIGGNTGNGNLLLNYFCGNDVSICQGTNGGIVAMGQKVVMNKNVKIGDASNNAIDANTALSIHGANASFDGLKFISAINTAKLITINNSNFSTSPFTVFADGKTIIGDKTQTGSHTDALLAVNGKMVAKSCYITQQQWADYVFAKDYKLPNLDDVETYYLANKHLPDVPSEKEIIENGVNVGDMQKLLLQKIEELTLYTVELNKQMQLLKEDNKTLKTQLNTLNH